MRRRFWLSRRSAESTGVGAVLDVLPHLQRHLVGRDVYLSSRGFVSTDPKGWRRHVGFVGSVEAKTDDVEHWVVEVETTEEYEARQHEVVGGVTTGQQDADQVRLEIAQRLTLLAAERTLNPSSGYGMARIHAETAERMRPGQTVYATDNGTVTATSSPHSPVVGTFVRMDGDNAVVALDSGGAVTMQIGSAATAQNAVEAIASSPARSLIEATLSTARSLYRGLHSMASSAFEMASAREAVVQQFTALSYTDRTERATARGTSPVPLGRTTGTYTANIPITLSNDLDDLAVTTQRQQRELATAARRRQDEAVAQALQAQRPVVFPVDDPDADEHTRRICDLVERVGREAAQRYLGEPIRVDPQTGHITEAERLRIEEGVTAALRQRLDGDIRLVVDREMVSGQLQSHIVGSTTGEHRFSTNPAQQEQLRQMYAGWAQPYSFTQNSIGEQVRRIVGPDCTIVVTTTQPGHVLVTLGEDRYVHDVARQLQREKPVSSVVEVAGPMLRIDCDRIAQWGAILQPLVDGAYTPRSSSAVVAAPATGTVRLTNTSSEAYVIAPGALAVSSAPGAPTTWYNTDETTLSPGGVVDVPVHSVTATSSEPLTHVRSALPGVMASSPVAQWQQSDILRFATLSRPSGSDLDVIAEQRYGLERATGETDADLRSRCQLRWAERLPRDVSLTRTYIVDAVEVSPDPSCAAWLPRLLLWLGNEVAADDAVLRGLDDEIAASGQQIVLVYVAERRALRVETRKEWLEAGGGRVAWSTIQDRAATSAP